MVDVGIPALTAEDEIGNQVAGGGEILYPCPLKPAQIQSPSIWVAEMIGL